MKRLMAEVSMRTNTLIFVAVLLAAGAVSAEELTLDRAVETALTNNPEVVAAEARASAAASQLEGGKSRRMPKIGLSESFVYTNNPAEVFAFTLNQGRFDMGEFFLSDPNNPDPLSTFMTRIDLELPVYTGGKLSARINQAESMATAEEATLAHTRHKVAFETITAYVNLAKAREHVELLEKARTTTAEHVRIAEQYASQGFILDADLLQAKVYLSEMDEYLTQATNGARLAEAALNFQMGADQAIPRVLTPLPPAPAVGGDLDSWTDMALEDRRDLVAARLKLEAGRLEAKAARPGYFPKIAVLGNYALYDDKLFGANGHSGSIMAVAKIDLWGGGSDTAQRAAARHNAVSFEADVRRFEEGVRLEVQQAWQNLATARLRHATAESSLTAASEALRVRESRFRQGLDKMIDLLDAETSLREAEMRELTARYDVLLHTNRLHFVSGATLINTTEGSQ
jgi:outer membrane protein TolC